MYTIWRLPDDLGALTLILSHVSGLYTRERGHTPAFARTTGGTREYANPS